MVGVKCLLLKDAGGKGEKKTPTSLEIAFLPLLLPK